MLAIKEVVPRPILQQRNAREATLSRAKGNKRLPRNFAWTKNIDARLRDAASLLGAKFLQPNISHIFAAGDE